MRLLTSPQWARWRNPVKRARQVVTVEPGWWLEMSSHINAGNAGTLGTYVKGPVRTWQRKANDQYEIAIPGRCDITWDSDADTPTPTCEIKLVNALPPDFDAGETLLDVQGVLSPTHGGEQLRPQVASPYQPRKDRWGRLGNEWYGLLAAGMVYRIYEGWEDVTQDPKPWQEALDDGDIVQTRIVRCDYVSLDHDGYLVLNCRGITGITADERLYSNSDGGIVPRNRWPLRYSRWIWTTTALPTSLRDSVIDDLRTDYYTASTEFWYPSGVTSGGVKIHGHWGAHAVDGNTATFALSEGYASSNGADVRPWWEFDTWNKLCNGVRFRTTRWAGRSTPLEAYISVMSEGSWMGAATIPYDAGAGTHTAANIPYLKKVSVRPDETTYVEFPEFPAERVRITFRGLQLSPLAGPASDPTRRYRVGLRAFRATRRTARPGSRPVSMTSSMWKGPGNYRGYEDIVRDILLWAGWWLRPARDSTGTIRARGEPEVFGTIETTGAYSDEPLPAEFFDKLPPMDVIAKLADIVGYVHYEDNDGGVQWKSRNTFKPGNRDDSGRPLTFIPQIHEKEVLLDLSAQQSIVPLRSHLTIATSDPAAGGADIGITRYHADYATLLRGVRSPAIWTNGLFLKATERQRLAELLAMRMWMAANTLVIRIPGNPCLSVDDQVRVVDRLNSIDGIYYIQAISNSHNAKGVWTMTLRLALLGENGRWRAAPSDGNARDPRVRPHRPVYQGRRIYIVEPGDTWAIIGRRLQGMASPNFDPGPNPVAVSLARVQAMNVNQVPFGQEPTPGMILDW